MAHILVVALPNPVREISANLLMTSHNDLFMIYVRLFSHLCFIKSPVRLYIYIIYVQYIKNDIIYIYIRHQQIANSV